MKVAAQNGMSKAASNLYQAIQIETNPKSVLVGDDKMNLEHKKNT